MKKRNFLTGVLVFLFVSSLAADNEKPLILVSPLVIEGLSADEARIIETLIYSYINNLGETLIPGESLNGIGFTPSLQDGRIPDYTFSGSVTQNNDGLILTLEIRGSAAGERASLSSFYKTTGELALKARSMVEAVFAGKNPSVVSGPAEKNASPSDKAVEGELLTEGAVLGTWKGEPGIEIIRLRRGGQGIAVFSSGAQMNLLYSIKNNTLNVVQNSPNSERYYQRQGDSPAIPYLVARRLAEEAKPMRWEFLLYENGTVLRGIKTASVIHYELERMLEISHGVIQDVEWIRTGR
ncbi:MAG: hypothetical protein LBP81_01560 [Treponema sp.]|jgi:hypothetical protein|nr:hypothetical protein [Treponema sp.]